MVLSRLPADENDIMQYQSLKEVEETVNPLVGITSSKKKHKFEGLKGVRVVNENLLSQLVAKDQQERQEYQKFVKSKAGGDWGWRDAVEGKDFKIISRY